MWGFISTEASYQLNFNVGFSTTRSDVLVHLAQWQYWWWFWFAFLWSFYYLVVSKVVRYRSLKMRPKIVTSYRPHGKWGDFLAAIVPALWVLNILTNSNFILRLIEWQNESNLFTVRIRARQWYWVYKFELKNFADILTTPKNLGRNKWYFSSFGDLSVTDDYTHILFLRYQAKNLQNYWSEVFLKLDKTKKHHLVTYYDDVRDLDSMGVNFDTETPKFNYFTSQKFVKNNWLSDALENSDKFLTLDSDWISNNKNYFSFLNEKLYNFKKFTSSNETIADLFFNDNNSLKKNMYSDFVESSRLIKRMQGSSLPLRLIKNPLIAINNVDESSASDLFRFRFGDGKNNVQPKNFYNTNYLVLKQRKYSKKDDITSINKFYTDKDGGKYKVGGKFKYSGKPTLFNLTQFDDFIDNPISLYRMIKKGKKRNELIPVNLARRILRTKRTLVLPAHVNVTLITSSFDIVHSWFIPGLGIKLDCVPGRSTHHTFFMDSVGFYYGQCAEICGRYHHHMPIRVCALPFEHFLVWWNNFGLPKLIFTDAQKRNSLYYSFRKYTW